MLFAAKMQGLSEGNDREEVAFCRYQYAQKL